MKRLTSVAVLAAAMLAAPAYAQYGSFGSRFEPHWYVGAGAGVGNLNISGTDLTGLNNAQIDDKDTVYTVRTGVRFHEYMAVELGYYDLGSYAFHGSGVGAVDGTARAKSVGLSFVGIIPMSYVDLYGRIGFARSELKVNASTNLIATPANSHDKENEATYGVGARWNVSRNLGVFAEWMKNDKIEVDGYVIGVDFKF